MILAKLRGLTQLGFLTKYLGVSPVIMKKRYKVTLILIVVGITTLKSIKI